MPPATVDSFFSRRTVPASLVAVPATTSKSTGKRATHGSSSGSSISVATARAGPAAPPPPQKKRKLVTPSAELTPEQQLLFIFMERRWLDVKLSFLPMGVARLDFQKGPGTRTANENALKQLRSDAERLGLAPAYIATLVDSATRRRQDGAKKAEQALEEMRRIGGLLTAADAAAGWSTEGIVRLEMEETIGGGWERLLGEERAAQMVGDGIAMLELLARERWEGGLRAAALGGEYQPTAARAATLAALDEAAATGDLLRLLPWLLLSNRRCGAPSATELAAAVRACAGNRPPELDARAPLEARVLRAVWAQTGQWITPAAGAVGRGSACGAKGEWAQPVEVAKVLRDFERLGDLTDGTPGGGGGVSKATGLVRGGDHAAGAFLLKLSDDEALKKASGAVSAALAAAALSADALTKEIRSAADALVDALIWPGRFERLGRELVASACTALRHAARTVPGAVGSVPTHELAELVMRVLGRSGVIELLADDGGQEEEEQAVAMAVDDEEEEEEEEETGLEGGESVGVGWRSARARAENARALCSLVRALRLWAGAGEGSDAGADAVERARQLAEAAAAMPALLGADVGGGMCLLELMASPEAHARIAAWGMRGMWLELVEVQGKADRAEEYRRSRPGQEWTASVVRGEEIQRRTFKAVALWPPEGPREVHLAAVGVAERELQAVARILSPDGRALMGAGWLAWHDNAVGWMNGALRAIAAATATAMLDPKATPTLASVSEAARASMAMKSPEQKEELETELRGARLQGSLEALLLRTAELRGSTPPLPHRDFPRGRPAWLPSLSKATTLYVALVDALFAAREWQTGAGVGVVWAWLTALAAAGPRLRRPLSEAPLRVGTVALVLVPRTGCCAVLEYLAQHGTSEVQQLVAALPGDIRQRPGLMHACPGEGAATALLVAREPGERMLSLLRLHCVGGARWAGAWQSVFGLAEPHAAPGTLATALLRVLAEGEVEDQHALLATLALEARLRRARSRVLRLLPLWRLAEAFGAGAGTRVEVPYHQDGRQLVLALRKMGWLRPDAPPRMPRRHCSPDGVTATDEATAAAVRQLCERLGWITPPRLPP